MAEVLSCWTGSVLHFQRLELLGNHVNGPISSLQPAPDDNKWLGPHQRPLPVVQVRLDDQIHQAVLVLQHQEDAALGGSRSLTADDQPGYLHDRAVRERL